MDKSASREAPNLPRPLGTSPFRKSQGDQPQAGEFRVQLTAGSEVEGVHSQSGGNGRIFLDVVNVERLVGGYIQSLQGMPVDGRRRLDRSHPAGIRAHWKMPDKWVCGFDMRDVDRVGIGEQGKEAPGRECFKQ